MVKHEGCREDIRIKYYLRGFPGGPEVGKLPAGRGHGFEPWSGNRDPTCHAITCTL